MIRLYHAALTRSVRIRWLLEELGLEHQLVTLDFLGGETQKPEYREKNPLGHVPTLEDGDIRIFESGAIVQYLVETYGEGRLAPPVGDPRRPEYLQWLHWAEATAMPCVSDFFQESMIKAPDRRIPEVIPQAIEKMHEWIAVVDEVLAGRTWMLGDEFTAADIMMGYPLYAAKMVGQLDERFPEAQGYVDRLSRRPAFQKAAAG